MALDFKGVEWQAVEVDPFTKKQMHHLRCRTRRWALGAVNWLSATDCVSAAV
jgi:hypothetical protein